MQIEVFERSDLVIEHSRADHRAGVSEIVDDRTMHIEGDICDDDVGW